MPNAYLIDKWNLLDQVMKVIKVKVMARIDAHAQSLCHFSSSNIGGDGGCPVGFELMGIGFSVELYPVCTSEGGTCYHGRVGIAENAGPDAG